MECVLADAARSEYLSALGSMAGEELVVDWSVCFRVMASPELWIGWCGNLVYDVAVAAGPDYR